MLDFVFKKLKVLSVYYFFILCIVLFHFYIFYILDSKYICVRDRLHFHEHCGSMVRLTNSNRTAERKKPVDEFNNGVVMTHRPILDDELFEVK